MLIASTLQISFRNGILNILYLFFYLKDLSSFKTTKTTQTIQKVGSDLFIRTPFRLSHWIIFNNK
jgi:hypothetical protein